MTEADPPEGEARWEGSGLDNAKHADTALTREQWRLLLCLTEEGHSLRAIAQHPGMPGWQRLRQHIRASGGRAASYARARQLAAEAFEDRLLQELETLRGEDTAAMRLRIDTLKWLMAKRAPTRYGDRPEAAAPTRAPTAPDIIRRIIIDPSRNDQDSGA